MDISGPTLVLRSVAPADVDALRTIHADPVVASWWGPPGPGWPLEEDEPGLVALTMWRDDAIVGFIQFWEEPDDRYRYAAIDLFVAPAHHRQGIASEALAILVDHLVTSAAITASRSTRRWTTRARSPATPASASRRSACCAPTSVTWPPATGATRC